MEGATWMCDKIIKEIEKYDQMEANIINEFEQRLTSISDGDNLAIE